MAVSGFLIVTNAKKLSNKKVCVEKVIDNKLSKIGLSTTQFCYGQFILLVLEKTIDNYFSLLEIVVNN